MQSLPPNVGPCRSEPNLSALHAMIIDFENVTDHWKAALASSYWTPQESTQPHTSLRWALWELNTSLRLGREIYSSSLTTPSARSHIGGFEQASKIIRRNICGASSALNRRST